MQNMLGRQSSGGKPPGANDASPLSLLVHAADAQPRSAPGTGLQGGSASGLGGTNRAGNAPGAGLLSNKGPGANGNGGMGALGGASGFHGVGGAPAAGAPTSNDVNGAGGVSLEDQVRQAAAARAEEALRQQHGLLRTLHSAAGGGGNPGVFGGGAPAAANDALYQESLLAAQQQQQQVAAFALATDLRTAMAAAQLRQAAQFGNNDLLLARAAALQQQLGLGGMGGGGGGGVQAPTSALESLQQELDLQRLEEFERRQLLAAAAAAGGGGGLGGLTAAQQLELQEAQFRQEQELRGLTGASVSGPNPSASNASADELLNRAAQLRAASAQAAPAPTPTTAPERAGPAPSSAPAVRVNATGGGTNSAGSQPTTVAEAAQNKDSFQKTPGSVVVPCRARGMPMDHNFKTAYFVIPENVEHGEELICSYFACRNAGIKFRYCTHCKVPVAKRNFRKRHKHGKSTSAALGLDDDGDGDDNSEENVPTPTRCKKVSNVTSVPSVLVGGPPALLQQEKSQTSAQLLPPQPRDPPNMMPRIPEGNGRKAVVESYVNGTSMSEPPSVLSTDPTAGLRQATSSSIPRSGNAAIHSRHKKITPEREDVWNGLLAKRPPTKDGDAVSHWLMEVLRVSDLDTPLDSISDSGGGGNNGTGGPVGAGSMNSAAMNTNTSSSSSLANSNDINGAAAALVASSMARTSQQHSSGGGGPKQEDRSSRSSASPLLKKKRPLPSVMARHQSSGSAADEDRGKGSRRGGGGGGSNDQPDRGNSGEYPGFKHRKKPKKSFTPSSSSSSASSK